LEDISVGTVDTVGSRNEDKPLLLKNPQSLGDSRITLYPGDFLNPFIPREAPAMGVGVIEESEIHRYNRQAVPFLRKMR